MHSASVMRPFCFAGVKDTPVPVALTQTYTEGDFPAAAMRHYSTAAHACGYREQLRRGLFLSRGSIHLCWRGFAAACLA